MNSLTRSVLRLCCAAPLLFSAAFAGCAKQGEGERCDATNSGSDDCESPLVCVRAEDLKDPAADRCCSESFADDRCRRRPIGVGGTGGADDAGNDAPANSEASDGNAGSDGGLVCEGASDCGDTGPADVTSEGTEADTMDSPDDASDASDASDGAGGTAGTAGDANAG